jgi:curved DNA-binding protein CbpA
VATHYERLGVAPTATAADIRAAYRVLAWKNHPDRADGSESARGLAAREMAEVNEAWRVLGDAERRAAYDATLAWGQRPREAERAEPRQAPDAGPADTIDADDDIEEDWRLDLPITDGRAVRTLGIMVAVTGVLALAGVIALFAYAILWAG